MKFHGRTTANVTLCCIIVILTPSKVAYSQTSKQPYSRDLFTDARDEKPFSQPIKMTDAEYDQFILGRSFFTIPWVAAPSTTTARDGLGPHFNANTCNSCHANNGGAPTLGNNLQPLRTLVFKLTQPNKHEQRWAVNNPETPFHGSVPDPVYGAQVAINGNGTVAPEAQTKLNISFIPFAYPDGQTLTLTEFSPYLARLAYGPISEDTTISLRQPPALAGLGLIEQVPDSEILAWADPEDDNNDGISGRANWLNAPGQKPVLGRFNWKATEATIAGQVANAAAHDMGLTNQKYPKELCQPKQTDCLNAPTGRESPYGKLDLPAFRLTAMAAYVRDHKAPITPSLEQDAASGKQLFNNLGCSACHRANLTTQQGVTFHPYSDFLLHDMGKELADKRPEFLATEREYRTAPLWGLGARVRAEERFLHDARAATPEEAILWHNGEAAASKTKFVRLGRTQRAALLHFLEQL